jgi:ribosome-associated heat shock protein Hsp15
MSDAGETARLDVWLWRARLFKTRSVAAGAVAAGAVRLSRAGAVRLIDRPATPVRAGDVILVAGARGLAALEIRALGVRRGPATEARALYAHAAGFLDADATDSHTTPGAPPPPNEHGT